MIMVSNDPGGSLHEGHIKPLSAHQGGEHGLSGVGEITSKSVI